MYELENLNGKTRRQCIAQKVKQRPVPQNYVQTEPLEMLFHIWKKNLRNSTYSIHLNSWSVDSVDLWISMCFVSGKSFAAFHLKVASASVGFKILWSTLCRYFLMSLDIFLILLVPCAVWRDVGAAIFSCKRLSQHFASSGTWETHQYSAISPCRTFLEVKQS